MTMKKRKKEKTIFRTILFAMLLVLGIEIVLLVSALYLSNVSTRLNQNAMDLLDMQTSNRADYLESILLFNQDLSRLSSCINEKASELSAAQKLDLSRIGDSSAEALPLLEEISSTMIPHCAVNPSPGFSLPLQRRSSQNQVRFPQFRACICGIWIPLPLLPQPTTIFFWNALP